MVWCLCKAKVKKTYESKLEWSGGTQSNYTSWATVIV